MADPQLLKLVQMDLELRQQARLRYGDSCDPSKQGILDKPPTVGHMNKKFGQNFNSLIGIFIS
jgi:hypothetical protein